ncbi:MAG TPA: HAMP domain-containing protein [Firmicutes bacterium]|nr:HAMP domain-containing protein [Bacillota bacterium]
MQSSIRARLIVALIGLLLASLLFQGIMQSLMEPEISSTYWLAVGYSVLLLGPVAVAVAIWLANDPARPLEQMTRAAQRVAAGDLAQPVTVKRQDELGRLATSFNRLMDTNQRRYQEIMEAKAQFETVIQNTVSGILMFDAQGTVFLSNPKAGQVLGFDPDGDVPDHFERLAADPNLCAALRTAIARQEPYKQTVSIGHPVQREIELHVIPLAAGEQFVAVFYDVSEASRLARIRADLVANVSHELKTPVTSIHGFAETILNDELVSDPTGKHFMEIIYRESRRLMRLVNDLLDLSYLELDPNAIAKQPVNLVEILQDVVERDGPQAAEKQIELKLVIGVKAAIMQGDEYRLSQALDNLIGNAIKYTPPGGSIRINLQYEKNGFQIAVRDTGVGIEPEHIERIFERFYRTDKARSRQHGGTGLGLSIVKHIVESHGGQVWVESKVGEGSVFYVHLPVEQDK